MSEPAERVAVVCPACGHETVHEVLKPGGQATVRCTECGHTHKTEIETETEIEKDVVVSQDGESYHTTVDAPPEEQIAVGEEFIVDTPEAIQQVRITGIELAGDKRVEKARVEDAATIWTRVVDNVAVNVTLHPKEESRDETRSLKVHVPGDYEFTVGETEDLGGEEFTVEGILVRDDATGYDFEKLDHDGDTVVAKDVKRVYVRDESTSAWSAW